ncbi:MAG TPA: hypothetical protein PK614_06095, partial [Nitrospira sp.]|nr:hypothetical protein [Nitrospira sp.]
EMWDAEKESSGASPARTEITLTFSSGQSYRVGRYPIYSVSKLEKLFSLTREKGKKQSYDIKSGKYYDFVKPLGEG